MLLASSESKSDDVVFNFLEHYDCDYITWFNAIAPLQTSEDINGFVKALLSESYDSLFSIKSEYVQANFKEQPLNFSLKGKFSKTQDLEPIKLFVPSLMGWDSKTFRKNYLKNQFSFFNGNVGYYEIKSKLSALVIKNEQDFKLIRSVIEDSQITIKKLNTICRHKMKLVDHKILRSKTESVLKNMVLMNFQQNLFLKG